MEEIWRSFWKQLRRKKNLLELDSSTFFHYVVLEFLGYLPYSKVSDEEKKMIRELRKGTKEYENLFNLYHERIKEYCLSE